MRNKKKTIGLLIALLLAVGGTFSMLRMAGALTRSGEKPSSGTAVYLVAKSTTSAFWKSVFAGARAAAAEHHVELVCTGPAMEEDWQGQSALIKDALTNGADALVCSAVDYEKNAPDLEYAADRKIPVVAIDSEVGTDAPACYIGTDNRAAGEQAAQEAIRLAADVGEPICAGLVNFDLNTANGAAREAGVREYLEQDPTAQIVVAVSVNSTIESAKTATLSMLRDHPQLNTLITFNEWTTLGVGEAIRESGRKDIRVIGFDSHATAVDMLETGELDVLIVQNPYAIGYLGVKNAWQLLNGGHADKRQLYTDTIAVTKEMMYSENSQRILFPFDK